jgi:trans-aconitate methyltransferase
MRQAGSLVREKLGFGGEVAEFYHRYRRHGYPEPVIDVLVDAFGLNAHDVVVDLGCGTGQLSLPVARRVRTVVGMDPEPDMLQRARQAANGAGVSNVSWMLGADTDLPALQHLLGQRPVAAVTIGQALHWMRHEDLFQAAVPLLRPGGGIAVVANGTPLWLQHSAWSQGLREFLEAWLGTTLSSACGTDQESQHRYQQTLAQAGYTVSAAAAEYVAELSASSSSTTVLGIRMLRGVRTDGYAGSCRTTSTSAPPPRRRSWLKSSSVAQGVVPGPPS